MNEGLYPELNVSTCGVKRICFPHWAVLNSIVSQSIIPTFQDKE